ncbi:hypothetical protein AB0M44_13810 [Streptosporangium subroseum]|uniref:hypothetical protein n=1 Tax=Streptosporangium subroseum TaxID=106412 RepID=UPI0034325E7A
MSLYHQGDILDRERIRLFTNQPAPSEPPPPSPPPDGGQDRSAGRRGDPNGGTRNLFTIKALGLGDPSARLLRSLLDRHGRPGEYRFLYTVDIPLPL